MGESFLSKWEGVIRTLELNGVRREATQVEQECFLLGRASVLDQLRNPSEGMAETMARAIADWPINWMDYLPTARAILRAAADAIEREHTARREALESQPA